MPVYTEGMVWGGVTAFPVTTIVLRADLKCKHGTNQITWTWSIWENVSLITKWKMMIKEKFCLDIKPARAFLWVESMLVCVVEAVWSSSVRTGFQITAISWVGCSVMLSPSCAPCYCWPFSWELCFLYLIRMGKRWAVPLSLTLGSCLHGPSSSAQWYSSLSWLLTWEEKIPAKIPPWPASNPVSPCFGEGGSVMLPVPWLRWIFS